MSEGHIPEGWKEAPFSVLADYVNGRAFKPTDWGKAGLPIVRIAQITNPDAEPNFYEGPVDARNLIDTDDLIFSWSATLAVLRWTKGPAILNQHLFKVSPAVGVDKNWLQYRLEASIPDLVEEAHGTTMKHIRKGTLSSQTTFLPPLDEQRRIAEVLRSVDDAIATTQKSVDAASTVRQVTLDALVEAVLDDAASEVRALSDIAEVRTGLAKNKNRTGPKVQVPYLRVANVQDGWFDLSDMQEIEVDPGQVDRYRLQSGDVLLTEGGDYDKLGRGGVWHGQIAPCLHQNHLFCVRADARVLTPEYFALATQSKWGRAYFLSCAKRTTNLASINSSQLRAFPVPLVGTALQARVIEEIAGIDAMIDLEEDQLQTLSRVRVEILSDLLTGKVRVPA